MKEHPIIFSGEGMVNAILQGRKTQTRRVVKPQPDSRETEFWPDQDTDRWFGVCPKNPETGGPTRGNSFRCPYGKPGDLLWVRETAGLKNVEDTSAVSLRYRADGQTLTYKSGHLEPYSFLKWTPSIHMPKWACRIWLEVLNVRVERVREIGEEDALAEGVGTDIISATGDHPNLECYVTMPDDHHAYVTAVDAFRPLWDKLNAKRGYPWSLNPWVWSILFRRIKHGKQRQTQEAGS